MTHPDVFLISIDCLRPDHVGTFNRLSHLTPRMDHILERGTIFTRAFSHAPFTTPAVASLLTGRYPFQNGVRLLLGQLCNPNAGTLADAAKRAGYVTAGFPSSFILNSTTGLNRGFDEYRNIRDGVMTHRGGCWQYGEPLNQALDGFLTSAGNDRVFCWLHYFDLHEYHLDESAPPQMTYARDLRDKVDGGCFTELLRILESHDRLDRAAFIITADHGECLYQHGVRGHGQHLYNSVLHVPLGIVWPGRFGEGEVRSQMARHVDLLPTLLDLWQLERDDAFTNLPGRSLLEPTSHDADVVSYAEASPRQLFDGNAAEIRRFEGPEIQTLQTASHKLIRQSDGTRELYDLRYDPGEVHNLLASSDDQQQRADALESSLDALSRPKDSAFSSSDSAEPQDDLVRQRLCDLGYV